MILRLTVFVLAAVAIQLKVPPNLRKNFDGNKLILPTDHSVGESLLGNWTDGAVSSLIDCLARERMKKVPESYRLYYNTCKHNATRVGQRAKCLMKIVNKQDSMKRRARHRTLKRVDMQLRRRVDMVDRKRKLEQKNSAAFYHRMSADFRRRVRRSIVSKDSYSLQNKEGSFLAGIARHLKIAVARLTGQTMDGRSWRSLTDELRILKDKARTRERLKAMLNRGMTSSSHFPEDGASPMTLNQEQKTIQSALGVLREGVEIALNLGGRNESLAGKNIRLLSPRFSHGGDDDKDVSLLSPEISPGSSADADAWIDFLMTSSGATEGMRNAKERLSEKEDVRRDEPLQMTRDDVEETLGKKERRKIDVITKMEKTYTQRQNSEFANRGFSFMTSYQKRLVYGNSSPYHDPVLSRSTKGMSDALLEKRLMRGIRLLASKEEDFERRLKQDSLLSPLLFGSFINQPPFTGSTVLSPVLFSVFVSSPTIIGPLILSPWVFTPLVMSPWAFCPIILSPFLFSPLIISPVALSVYVLTPGIFSPAILSPLLMVPYILSPNFASPAILSPLVLSPFVLTPTAASPLILSPVVLSPVVFSPSLNSSLILSPTVLSPPIESEAQGAMIILSPSI